MNTKRPPAPEGGWFVATRAIDCPTCNAPAGHCCTELGPPFRERGPHHVLRYELARELAGRPIRHATRHVETLAALREASSAKVHS